MWRGSQLRPLGLGPEALQSVMRGLALCLSPQPITSKLVRLLQASKISLHRVLLKNLPLLN